MQRSPGQCLEFASFSICFLFDSRRIYISRLFYILFFYALQKQNLAMENKEITLKIMYIAKFCESAIYQSLVLCIFLLGELFLFALLSF